MDGLDSSPDMDHVSQSSYRLSDRDLDLYCTIAAERKAFDHAMILFRKREAKGSEVAVAEQAYSSTIAPHVCFC